MNEIDGQNEIPAADGSAIPEGGTPGTGEAPGSSIPGQNGQPASAPQGQPNLAEENQRLKGHISALQKQIIASRRSPGGQTPPVPGSTPGQGGEGGSDVASQIAIAYEMADGQLRRQMEPVFDLYPELTKEELSMLRRNPWAFASRESFMTGDVESAKLEIEQWIADVVEARATGNPPPAPPSGKPVNPNPAPSATPEPATPGSAEDQNPWTMPMDKLEHAAAKEVAKRSRK